MPANQSGGGTPTVVHDLDGLQNVAQSRQIGEVDRHVAAVRVHRNPTNLQRLASLRTVDTLAERGVEIGEKGRVALAGRYGDEANEGRVEKLRLILAAVVCVESARLDVAFPIAGLELRGKREAERRRRSRGTDIPLRSVPAISYSTSASECGAWSCWKRTENCSCSRPDRRDKTPCCS